MPHNRKRLLHERFLKDFRFWPVISLMGPRQCGKSFFLQNLLWSKSRFDYVTLDRAAQRETATRNPELFLQGFSKRPLVIDEAQKAPPIFDEIKAVIDERRKPG